MKQFSIRLLKDSEKYLINGTSYIGTIETSINELKEKIGQPQFINTTNINDKSHFEWICGIIDNNNPDIIIPFTLYDYKANRMLSNDEIYDFHIGAFYNNAHIVKQVLTQIIFH